MFKDMYVKTERLLIRPINVDDIQDFYEILSQEEVVEYLPEDVMSMEEVKEIISWLNDCYEKNTLENIIKFTVVIVHKENNKVIGWCGVGPLEYDPSDMELFYGIRKEYWGKGIATEASKAMLHYGFDTIGLEKIVAVVKPENVASKKVIEKIGMTYQKKIQNLPKKYSFYEGELYYSLSKGEYLKTVKGQN